MSAKLSIIQHASGISLAAGLFWQPLLSGSKKESHEKILEVADQLSFDLGVIVGGEHGVGSAGLCAKAEGAKEGFVSLALLVSDGLTKQGFTADFVAGIDAGDGRWVYVARNNGAIIFEGDFIGTEEEVRSMMMQHYSMAEWPTIIAPSHWRFSGSVEKSLDDILPKGKKGRLVVANEMVIRPLRTSAFDVIKAHKKLVFLVSLVIGVAGFGNNYYKIYKEKVAAELAARKAAEAAFAKRISAPPPWYAEAAPVPMAAACMSALDKIPLVPGGWNLGAATCNSSGIVTAEWTRPDYGSISMLRGVVPNAEISADGNKASQSSEVKPGEVTRELVTGKSEGYAHIFDRMQTMGIEVRLTPVQEAPPKEGDPPVPWQATQWSITTQLRPDEIAKVLTFPGLRISNITLSFDGGSVSSYKMEGLIYAKK